MEQIFKAPVDSLLVHNCDVYNKLQLTSVEINSLYELRERLSSYGRQEFDAIHIKFTAKLIEARALLTDLDVCVVQNQIKDTVRNMTAIDTDQLETCNQTEEKVSDMDVNIVLHTLGSLHRDMKGYNNAEALKEVEDKIIKYVKLL